MAINLGAHPALSSALEKGRAYGARALPLLEEYAASGATMLLSAGCQFLWFIILARCLGVETFGALMIIMAVTALAMTLCGLGAGDAILRRTSRDANDYSPMLGHGLLVIAVTGTCLVTAAVLVLRWLLAAQSAVPVSTTGITLFAITNVITATLVTHAEYIYLGLGQPGRANLIEVGFSLVRLASAVLACLVFGVTTLDTWAWWTMLAHLGMLWVVVRMLAPLGKPRWHLDVTELKLGFHYCTPRMLDALRQNSDRIVLGAVASASALANYAIAARMTNVAQLAVNSMNRIAYPRFTRRKAEGISRVLPAALTYLVLITAVAALAAFCTYLIAPWLPVLIGAKYDTVVPNLRILAWLLVPLAMQTVPYDLLGAFDRHRERAWIYNSLSLAGVALTALAIYMFGVLGALASAYIVETSLAMGLWMTLIRLARSDATAPPPA